jgi:hypothetical protein
MSPCRQDIVPAEHSDSCEIVSAATASVALPPQVPTSSYENYCHSSSLLLINTVSS